MLRERASLQPNDPAFTFIDYDTNWDGVAHELTWAQLHQLKQLAFASEEARVFRADFIDGTGTKVSHSFTVRLHCNGNPACEGHCVVQGAACPITTQQQCYGGRCASSGCRCCSTCGSRIPACC